MPSHYGLSFSCVLEERKESAASPMSRKIGEKENRGRTVPITPTGSKTWIKNIISHIATKKREELPESTVTLSVPYEGRTGKALLTMLPVSSEQAQL